MLRRFCVKGEPLAYALTKVAIYVKWRVLTPEFGLLYCTGTDTCGATGLCSIHTGNPCTTDVCDEWHQQCGAADTCEAMSVRQ